MKTNQTLVRFSLVGMAVFLSLFSFVTVRAADAMDGLGTSAGSVAVPPGLNKADVKKAALAALAGRQWTIKDQTDDEVVGYLRHRSNEAKLTLKLSESSVELFCVGWEINKKTGERKKPEMPESWIKYIKEDLNKNFGRILTSK